MIAPFTSPNGFIHYLIEGNKNRDEVYKDKYTFKPLIYSLHGMRILRIKAVTAETFENYTTYNACREAIRAEYVLNRFCYLDKLKKKLYIDADCKLFETITHVCIDEYHEIHLPVCVVRLTSEQVRKYLKDLQEHVTDMYASQKKLQKLIKNRMMKQIKRSLVTQT